MARIDHWMSIIDLPDPPLLPHDAPPMPTQPPEPNYFSTQVSDARRFYLELNPGSRGRGGS